MQLKLGIILVEEKSQEGICKRGRNCVSLKVTLMSGVCVT
jgi:hypothetical protein